MFNRSASFVLFLWLLLIVLIVPLSRAEEVPFDSTHWDLSRAGVEKHLGRDAITGFATLNDVSFMNGILSVDVAFVRERSYPGFRFRIKDGEEWEELYIRPHRMGLYEDAVQYTPSFRDAACWQLYNGTGWTAGIDLPENEWIHFEIWVKDDQALVFLGEETEPALFVPDLVIDPAAGGIALYSSAYGTAYFSNFSYTLNDDLEFPPSPPVFPVPGIVNDWEVSQPLPFGNVDKEQYFTAQGTDLSWQPVVADKDGRVNLTEVIRPDFRGVWSAWVRTTFDAQESGYHKFNLAYSDWITVFINGQPVYQGHSAYRERESSFLGAIGLFDAVYVPLNRGSNEITLLISEALGGSGFILQDGESEYKAGGLKQIWATVPAFGYPESVAYDPARNCYYASNYFRGGNEAISRISTSGEVLDTVFVDGLRFPAGVTVHDGFIWSATGGGMVQIDPDERKIVNIWPTPQGSTPNDICFDADGHAYISDTRNNRILRWDGEELAEWLTGSPLDGPNGVLTMDDKLWVGNFEGGQLVELSIKDKTVMRIIQLPLESKLDGVADAGEGNLIVSGYEGRIFRVDTETSAVELLFDTTNEVFQAADLTVIPEQKLILVPSYMENRVIAFEYD